MNEICLVVIYNHNFEQNIEVVKRIYAGRFSHVYQIMPFYRGSDPSVIGVYECSYQFNGYIAQAASRIRDTKYSHYVFIADDMMLNPTIDEHNILKCLNLEEGAGFFREFSLLTNRWAISWNWGISTVASAECRSNACQWWNSMPTLDSWRECFGVHGFKWQNGYDGQLLKRMSGSLSYNVQNPYIPKKKSLSSELIYDKEDLRRGYPFVTGFSDFFVIPASAFNDFTHYCGVFAAMRVFVEAAIPTSMVLSCSKIQTIRETEWKTETGVVNAVQVRRELEERFELSFAKLAKEYPKDYLFIHPIKLSRWRDLPQ